jgi:hypothetical protein
VKFEAKVVNKPEWHKMDIVAIFAAEIKPG